MALRFWRHSNYFPSLFYIRVSTTVLLYLKSYDTPFEDRAL